MQKINEKIGNTNICYSVLNDFKMGETYTLDMILTDKKGERIQARVNLPKGWNELDLKNIVITSLFQLDNECMNVEVTFKKVILN